MAAIGTIRKYSGIAVGAIGLSILTFVITDAFQRDSMLFRGKGKNLVGVIAGEKITYPEFEGRLKIELESYKKRNNIQNITDEVQSQVVEQLWTKIQDEIIYAKEYKAAGIDVGSDELSYTLTGPDPHPAVKQFFVNDKKEFDRAIMVRALQNMDEYPDFKEIWLDFEGEVQKEKLKTKYFNLVKNSLLTSKLEARNDFYNKNKYATFDYLSLPYRDIPDSTVKPTEKELKAYWEKHKYENEIEEMRIAEYVTFDIFPTKEDSLAIFKLMEITRADFAATTNDTLFIQARSETPLDTVYHNLGYFREEIDKIFFGNHNTDTVIGPYFEGGYLKVAKLLDKKTDSVYYYKASHILIKPDGGTKEDTLKALKRANQMAANLRKGGNFADSAMMKSQDYKSAAQGGDLGWFEDGKMVKPFMDAVKKGKKGDIVVVKSEFGAHVIKITEDKNNTTIKVGIVSKKIEPSSETYRNYYAKAMKFRGQIENAEDFQKMVNEQKLDKRITPEVRPNEKEIPGLTNGKRLINWMYQAKKNDVSDILEFGDKYVVALLTEAYEKGPAPLDRVKSDIELKVIKEKKKEILRKKLEKAYTKGASLESVAKKLNLNIEKINDANFDVTVVPGLGEEKFLMGYVFGSAIGTVSEIIEGENGVYLIVVKNFSKVEEPKDLTETINRLNDNYKGMSQYFAMEALKENANIQDKRYLWY